MFAQSDPEQTIASALRDGLFKEILLNDRLSKVCFGSSAMTQVFQYKIEETYRHIYSLHQLYGTFDSTICQFDSFFKKYLLSHFEYFFTNLEDIQK